MLGKVLVTCGHTHYGHAMKMWSRARNYLRKFCRHLHQLNTTPQKKWVVICCNKYIIVAGLYFIGVFAHSRTSLKTLELLESRAQTLKASQGLPKNIPQPSQQHPESIPAFTRIQGFVLVARFFSLLAVAKQFWKLLPPHPQPTLDY